VRVIDEARGLEELVRELRDAPGGFVLDTETRAGADARPVGIGFSTERPRRSLALRGKNLSVRGWAGPGHVIDHRQLGEPETDAPVLGAPASKGLRSTR
jgi:hypothetical protein